MSPLLIPVLALLIPVIVIVANHIVKPLIALKERQMQLNASMTAEKAAQYAAHSERLEQRVRVLERIVTNRGMDLGDEIERLRDQPASPALPLN